MDKFFTSGNQFENVLAKMPGVFQSVASPGSKIQLGDSSNGRPVIELRNMMDQPEQMGRRKRRQFLRQTQPLGSRAQRRRLRSRIPLDPTVQESDEQ